MLNMTPIVWIMSDVIMVLHILEWIQRSQTSAAYPISFPSLDRATVAPYCRPLRIAERSLCEQLGKRAGELGGYLFDVVDKCVIVRGLQREECTTESGNCVTSKELMGGGHVVNDSSATNH